MAAASEFIRGVSSATPSRDMSPSNTASARAHSSESANRKHDIKAQLHAGWPCKRTSSGVETFHKTLQSLRPEGTGLNLRAEHSHHPLFFPAPSRPDRHLLGLVRLLFLRLLLACLDPASASRFKYSTDMVPLLPFPRKFLANLTSATWVPTTAPLSLSDPREGIPPPSCVCCQ